MGMTGNFASLSSDDFNSILEQPDRAGRLIDFQVEDAAGAVQKYISELRRLIEDPSNSVEIKERYKIVLHQLEAQLASKSDVEDDWKPGPGTKFLDVEKSWDGLNALLMLNEPEGSPLQFIIAGGQEIPCDDFGYGPPHGFTAEQTREIAARLETIDPESLITLENLKEFEDHDLYCFSADEENVEYLRNDLKELKIFIAEAAKANHAMLVYLA